jgi:hypothetical protein
MSYRKSLIVLCLVISGTLLPALLCAQIKQSSNESREIRIDPSAAKVGESAANYFGTVEYLPLETTKLSAFGEITQMEITPKYYIIWDAKSNCILFFDKKGAFFSKITNTDKSLNILYKKIDHFTINEKKGELMFNDGHSQYSYYYNLEGEFKTMVETPSHLGQSYINQERYKAYFKGYDQSQLGLLNKPNYNLIIDRGNMGIDFHLPFDTASLDYTDLYAVNQAFYNNQDGIVNFSAVYNYHVYSIDSLGKVWNSFNFIMPAVNTVPDDFLTNVVYKGKHTRYTETNEEVIYSITDVYQENDEVVFRLFGHNTNKVLGYNLTNGNLTSLSEIAEDGSTFMLPSLGGRIYAMDNQNRLVSAIDAITLFDLKSALKTEKWSKALPPSLKTFFTLDNQQNPVLTILKIK